MGGRGSTISDVGCTKKVILLGQTMDTAAYMPYAASYLAATPAPPPPAGGSRPGMYVSDEMMGDSTRELDRNMEGWGYCCHKCGGGGESGAGARMCRTVLPTILFGIQWVVQM